MNRRRFLISSVAFPIAGMIPHARASATDAPRVGIFSSSPRALSTNDYWLEGSDGLVFIDTQFLPSDALRIRETAMKETEKPVAVLRAAWSLLMMPKPT